MWGVVRCYSCARLPPTVVGVGRGEGRASGLAVVSTNAADGFDRTIASGGS